LELIVKEESKTDYNYGSDPYKRDIKTLLNTGLVVIDKPSGPTSHEVAAWVRNMLEHLTQKLREHFQWH